MSAQDNGQLKLLERNTGGESLFIYLFRSPHGHYIGFQKADIPVVEGSRNKMNVKSMYG